MAAVTSRLAHLEAQNGGSSALPLGHTGNVKDISGNVGLAMNSTSAGCCTGVDHSQMNSNSMLNNSNTNSSSKTLVTGLDGTSNLLSVPSRKSSMSPTSQAKSSIIECEEISGAAEISDFVVETDLSRGAGGSTGLSSTTVKKSKKLYKKVLSMSEQVDAFIDQCIEIESNKRMFQENVNWFLLTFESRDYESAVRRLFSLFLFICVFEHV